MNTNSSAFPEPTKAVFTATAFGTHMRCGALLAAILVLSALQPVLTLAESYTSGKDHGTQQWSVQVERVDPGAVSLDPSFAAATYENLLTELVKKKQFKQVFRSGDRNANDVPDLLILKTTVQEYTPGSETRRAVTTVAGATKLKVRIQLVTREDQLVLEHIVEGDVRFIGNNLRATHNLAHNVAATLKKSTLPEPAGPE